MTDATEQEEPTSSNSGPLHCLSGPVRYGEHGWKWWVGSDPATAMYDGGEMRTNSDGQGVFHAVVSESGLVDWQQVTGTGQFRAGQSEGAARDAIRRWHGWTCSTWVTEETASSE